MDLLPNETLKDSPISELTITNLRIRFQPSDQEVQSMFISEITYIGIVQSQSLFFQRLGILALAVAFIGAMGLAAEIEEGGPLAVGGAFLSLFFLIIVVLTRRTDLKIQSGGSESIDIRLKWRKIKDGIKTIDLLEEAKGATHIN